MICDYFSSLILPVGTDVTPSTDPSPTPEGNHTPTSNNSDFTNEGSSLLLLLLNSLNLLHYLAIVTADTFTNSAPVTLVISVFVTMVVIVFTVGLIIRVICKGKRYIHSYVYIVYVHVTIIDTYNM